MSEPPLGLTGKLALVTDAASALPGEYPGWMFEAFVDARCVPQPFEGISL